jgi:hypothetical protein
MSKVLLNGALMLVVFIFVALVLIVVDAALKRVNRFA